MKNECLDIYLCQINNGFVPCVFDKNGRNPLHVIFIVNGNGEV